MSAQIRAMYAAGEQGFVDDPASLASLLQDAAGTAPVTAPGQQVGLRLDTRLGLVRGAELSPGGGTFDSATGYTLGAGWSISSGVATRAAGAAASNLNVSGVVPAAAKTYKLEIDVNSVSGGALNIGLGGAPATTTLAVAGHFVGYVQTTNTSSPYIWIGSTGIACVVDNFSLCEIPGNPAVQATPGARPLYQTGPARLVFDGIDDAHVTTFATALGSNCTVVRSVPGVGTTILTGQTIGTTHTTTVTHSGQIVINRPLTASETALVTRWGNQRAGV